MVSHLIQPGSIYRVLKQDADGQELLAYWARELDSLTVALPEYNGSSDKTPDKKYVGNFELGRPLASQGGTSVTCLVRAICNDPFGRNGDSSIPRYQKDGVCVMKSLAPSQNALLAFVNEMMIFSLLGDASENNIATLVDYNDNPKKGPLYMVFDKIPYELQRDDEWLRKIEPARVVELAVGVARALCYMQKHGIVHGDIKPDNVRIDGDMQPLILDLGAAFVLQRKNGLENVEGLEAILQNEKIRTHGSIFYAPPEYLRYLMGESPINPKDFRYDAFSFGVMLYQMLTGDKPFSELVERNMPWQEIAKYHMSGVSPFRQELLDPGLYHGEDARVILSLIKGTAEPSERRMTLPQVQIELANHLERSGAAKKRRASSRTAKSSDLSAVEKARQELAALEAREAGADIHAPTTERRKKTASTDNDTVSNLDLKIGG